MIVLVLALVNRASASESACTSVSVSAIVWRISVRVSANVKLRV